MTDTTPEAVERLAALIDGEHLHPSMSASVAATLRAQAARIAELETENARLSGAATGDPVAWKSDNSDVSVMFTENERTAAKWRKEGVTVCALYAHPPRAAQTPPKDVGAIDIDALAFRIAVEMELHSAIGTTTQAKAHDIAATLRAALAKGGAAK